MPVIDGEKWACSSCIKGHRVSGCNHTDRDLHHINPKGRPVKQCEHCRGARKSKSHHAKCDCGDKKDKRNKDDPKSHCGCHTGGKCLCGGKKNTQGLRVDTSRQTLHDMRARPRVTAVHSESTLTVFANGHHRPSHRNNNSAHVSGLPYQLSRPNSHHESPTYPTFPSDRTYKAIEHSRDAQSPVNSNFHAPFSSTPRSSDVLPPTPLTGNLESGSYPDYPDYHDAYQEPLFTGRSSTFGQGNSPTESHMSETLSGPWPWTVNPHYGYDSLTTSPSQSREYLPAYDSEWALPSAGLVIPSWSAGDLPLDPNKLSEDLAEPISHSGESKRSAPGLTASSSPSESGDHGLFGELEYKTANSTTGESLFWEDSPVYRVAAPATNESRAPTSVPRRTTPEPEEYDSRYSKTVRPVAVSTGSRTSSLYGETQAIAMPTSAEETSPTSPWMANQSPVVYQSSIYATFNLPNTFNSWR